MLMLQWSLVHAAEDETKLSREQKIALLQRLRGATKQMHAQFLLQPAQVRGQFLVSARPVPATLVPPTGLDGRLCSLPVHAFVLIRLPTGMSFC